MKTVITAILAIFLITGLTGCTDNIRTRTFGGEQTINLEKGQRLVNVTWKKSNLWILTKESNTKPSTYTFSEDSSFGAFEGTIIIIEK
jgi:hypothetical protein